LSGSENATWLLMAFWIGCPTYSTFAFLDALQASLAQTANRRGPAHKLNVRHQIQA